jgi:predicted Holliday junction resolvase-like endonuclease
LFLNNVYLCIIVDDAEQNALRISQRAIEKLQQDVRMREQELMAEQKRHKEVQKNLAQGDRISRESKFQLEEVTFYLHCKPTQLTI